VILRFSTRLEKISKSLAILNPRIARPCIILIMELCWGLEVYSGIKEWVILRDAGRKENEYLRDEQCKRKLSIV